jgi:hypothetical protein
MLAAVMIVTNVIATKRTKENIIFNTTNDLQLQNLKNFESKILMGDGRMA